MVNDVQGGTDRDTAFHGKGHGESGRDKVIHRLLGFLHRDTTAADPVRGDVIVAQGAPPLWARYGLSVPAANVRNALGVDNGEVEPTWKTTLDATAPTTIAEGDAAAAGTSLIYSHRDHKHGSPATWKATAHNLLDGDRHGDTVAQGASRGSLVYGNSTPKWDELVIGSAGQRLSIVSSDLVWRTPASAQVTHSNPAGTASATLVHAGMGDTFTLTPNATGSVCLTVRGYMANSLATDGTQIQIKYGTGTAPVNGAADTGTALGPTQLGQSTLNNAYMPFSVSGVVTGLTIATAYWFDLSFAALVGGTSSLANCAISAHEF